MSSGAPEIRILGLVCGDPNTALSGVARHLLDGLDRRFDVVERLDYSPHGASRLRLMGATFRPSRTAWRAQFYTSLRAHQAQSRTLVRRLSELDQNFDLALQIHGWVAGQPSPYSLYIDQTRLMAERGWPEWLALPRRTRTRQVQLERAMYQSAWHVFVMAHETKASIVSEYGVEDARVTVVGGGFASDIRPSSGPSERNKMVLFVGRDFKRKGGDCLLQAFELVRARVPDAKLEMVGIRNTARAPGVVAHGQIWDNSRLARLYGRASVFCLPSRYEPYGLALVEAMASGVACVGTTVQAIPDILDHGRAGLLVPPGEPEPLADALVELLTDDDRARELGRAARRFAERNLKWEHVAERMAAVISRLPRR